MRYPKISTQIWHNKLFTQLSPDAKLLFFYLMTCPHSNSLGIFVLPKPYILGDLGWHAKRLGKPFAELFRNGFVTVDETVHLICLNHYLQYNRIENPNQAKAAQKLVEKLPKSPLFSIALEQLPEQFAEQLREQLRKQLPEQLPEQLPKLFQEPFQDTPKDRKPPTLSRYEQLEQFQVTEELREWGRKHEMPDPDYHIGEFKDYWRSVDPKKLRSNWLATYRNRLRFLKANPHLLTAEAQDAMAKFLKIGLYSEEEAI